MGLAAACDIAIAGEDAVFGEPEVRFGSGIVAMVLPWMVAPKHAKDILLTGNDQITAMRAAEIGLVTETVWEGRHVERAFEKAREIAAAAPLSVELTKRAIAALTFAACAMRCWRRLRPISSLKPRAGPNARNSTASARKKG